MTLKQSVYFMSLVGGWAGLISWALRKFFFLAFSFPDHPWVPEMVTSLFLGGLLGGMAVGFSDHWSGSRVPRWVFFGVLIGLGSGLIGGAVQAPIQAALIERSPIAARILTWTIVGGFIGLGLGLRWSGVNRARVAHAFAGGLTGGALGGGVFVALAGYANDVTEPVSMMLVGVGISFGIAIAPVLLSAGIIQFVSSRARLAQLKYGPPRQKQWEIQNGDSKVIGSQEAALSRTLTRPEVDLFIPDRDIAPRHAVITATDGRYYIARHKSAAADGYKARYELRVRGKIVGAIQELHDSDDILIGLTTLKFFTSQK